MALQPVPDELQPGMTIVMASPLFGPFTRGTVVKVESGDVSISHALTGQVVSVPRSFLMGVVDESRF